MLVEASRSSDKFENELIFAPSAVMSYVALFCAAILYVGNIDCRFGGWLVLTTWATEKYWTFPRVLTTNGCIKLVVAPRSRERGGGQIRYTLIRL